MKRFRTLLSCILCISLFLITNWAYATTFVVDNLGDVDDGNPYTERDGTNTLRKCIRLANENAGPDTIDFGVSGTISPTSSLPEITDDETVIDASSRWSGVWPSGQPGITLDGTNAGDGLNIYASKCHIRGLFITNFAGNGVGIFHDAQTIGGTGVGYRNVISGNKRSGVRIWLGANNKVCGNYIGTDVTGIEALGNSWDGVRIHGGAQLNTIGGTTDGERNIISGNKGHGVVIHDLGTDNNKVCGNYIGTDVNGTADLGNGQEGVLIHQGQSNIIGGITVSERNIISGNDWRGVDISGTGANNNTVSGNYIGTDVSGTADLGNSWSGVCVHIGAQSNTVGGETEGERNIISGNDQAGVQITDLETDNNKVCGNYIGTNVSGTAALGNSTGSGVIIEDSAQSNTIGGTTEGARNIISGNEIGVSINGSGTNNNVVAGNYIGTDVDGKSDLSNLSDGVRIHSGAQSNTIGGTTDGERNIISGNGRHGVLIEFSDTNNNVVSGNYIGTDVSGKVALGNLDIGVTIEDSAQSNTIGGTTEGARNIISGNWGGVRVAGTDTDFNKISQNSIHDNSDLGIDLMDGGNNEIPAPTITSNNLVDNTLILSGNGAGTNATVEIFEADSFESGEGEIYLGSLDADGSGNFSGLIDVTGKGLAVGAPLVATTTHTDNNTSEFSTPPVPVEGPPPMPQVVEVWPEPGATAKRESNIWAVFSKPMDESTLTDSTVRIEGTKSGAVTGSITYESGIERVVFTPDVPFAPNEQVTVTLTGDIKDTEGNGLDGDRDGVSEDSPEDDFRWEFSTMPHALSLDGDGDYMDCGNDDSLDITDAITIEAWVYPKSPFDTQEYVIKWNADPCNYWFLRHYDGIFEFTPTANEEAGKVLYTPSIFPINQWVHVVGTFDGSDSKIYVNGELKNSKSYTGSIDRNTASVNIGALGQATLPQQEFSGLIDEVRIWNIARTQAEIKTTMNTTLQGDETGLVGYWNFDDVTADDSSPSDNHGTLMGDAEIVPLYGPWPPPLRGDVSGDRTISAYDAALILRYVVGLIGEFPADSMVSPFAISPRSYIVEIPELSARAGDRIHVPIAINDTTGLWAGGISLKYDGTILKAINVLTDITLNGSYWKANTELDGEVRFAFATTEVVTTMGQGNLLMVEFEVLPNTEGKTSRLMVDHVKLSNSLNVTKINGSVTVIPSTFALLQNYPNPFNPDTWIPFELATDASVTISIYNAKGQLIRTIVLGQKSAGVYLSKDKAAYWDGRDDSGEKVSSGVYFYTLQTGKFTATRKLVVVK